MKIGFIGTGNMGGALATAASKKNVDILLANKPESVAKTLAEKIGGVVTDNTSLAKDADYIFVGVKPQNLTELASEIKDTLAARGEGFVIVSMLAGTAIERIEESLGAKYPIIRIMPNVAAMVGESMIMYSTNDAVTDGQVDRFLDVMSEAGLLAEIREDQMSAGAGVAGCGPAFAAMFIEALADGGVACGLTRAQAIQFAAQMAKGTAQYILETGIHPGALKDSVTSPGGTTIQGVRALEKGGFRSALFEAVVATVEKDKSL